MHKVLKYVAPVLRVTIALMLFSSTFLQTDLVFGRATLSVRQIVVGLYLIEALVQVLLIHAADQTTTVGIRNQQLKRHLKTYAKYLDAQLDEEHRGQIRINLFEHKRGHLKSCAHFGSYSNEELGLEWEVGRGACGLAFQRKENLFTNLHRIQEVKNFSDLAKDLDCSKFNLTPDLYGVTRDVLWVMCFYLRDEEGRAWGVLCFDSTSWLVTVKARNTIKRLVKTYEDDLRICYCT